MVFIPPPVISPYFKKDDAKEFFHNKRRNIIAVGLTYFGASLLVLLLLGSNTLELIQTSSEFNSYPMVLLSVIALCSGFLSYMYIAMKSYTNAFENEFFSKVAEYKVGEMINSNKIYNNAYFNQAAIVGLMTLCVILGIVLYPFFVLSGVGYN